MSYNANFWAHYNAAQTWMKFHKFAAEKAYNHSQSQISANVGSQNGFSKEKRRNLRKKRCKKSKTFVKCESHANENSELDYADMNEDVEMDADMVAFFKQTLEHRRQRDAERRKNEQRSKSAEHWAMGGGDDYVLAEEIDIYGIPQPSTAMPNVAEEFESRKKLMAKLYGSNADKITAMETFLDMRFEQYIDKYKPQLWPSIPLKL